MARHVVTGGAGFIGSHLACRLLNDGHEVRVIDDFSTGRRQNLAPVADRLAVLEGSICDAGLLRKAFEGADCVFHQAALASVQRSIDNPTATNRVNVGGTVEVLEAARACGVRRVVYAASSSAYGDSAVLPKREDMPPAPKSPYAVSKLAGEYYCKAYHTVFGLEAVALRYFNVFGPRQDPESQYAAVIPLFITALLTGTSPVVFGDGEQTRDFTPVDNVVEANLKAAHAAGAPGRVFNVGCGERHSLNELLDVLAHMLGKDVAPTYAESRPGDVRDSLADIGQARSVLGYEAAVDFAAGLRRTVEWYRRQAD